MKSFLNKRRKSISGSPPSTKFNDVEAPPLPIFARHQQSGAGVFMESKPPMAVEMPDLRFSKLDLEIDLSKIRGGGPDSRPGSVVQSEEKRRSKMAFLQFNNTSKASLTSEEIPATKMNMIPARSTSTAKASDINKAAAPLPPSAMRMHVPEQDRKKLVARATEAMNLDVPVKAPTRQQQQQQNGSVKLAGPTSTIQQPPKSKKELKKEEKERITKEKMAADVQRASESRERAARERERVIMERERAVVGKEQAKLAVKEAKEAAKMEKQLSRRTSKVDVENMRKQSMPELRSYPTSQDRARSEQRRALEATTRNQKAAVPSALPNRPSSIDSRSTQRGRPASDAGSKAGSSTSSGRRPPSAPPSQKPPLAPTNHLTNIQSRPHNRSTTPTQSIRSKTNSEAGSAAKHRSSQDRQEKTFDFPRQSTSGPLRSYSAIPAADGIPRPIVNRGSTLAPEKRISREAGVRGVIGSYGAPLTDSPPMHQNGSFAGSIPTKSVSRGIQKPMTRLSSSEEGDTSTSVDAPSLDSQTSLEDNMGDDGANDKFVDASQTFTHRPRPRRDGEREERAQSRLSGGFDVELIRALQADGASLHSRTESKDRFSALLMASRPGGAADRSADSSPSKIGTSAAAAETSRARMEAQRQRYLGQTTEGFRAPPPPPQPVKRVREAAPTPKRRIVVRPELVAEGNGWKCQGVGDVDVPNLHERFLTETILVPKAKSRDVQKEAQEGEEAATGQREPSVEFEEQQIKVRYNDLFELLWTSTTPDVISRLISHLDIADLKALRQTSHSVRFTLDVHDNREVILNQFLTPIGYRPWTYVKGASRIVNRSHPTNISKDPCPLSFNDCEAFLISQDLLPEYAMVGREFAAHPEQMDPRMARLAQASTRAYSRVLTRLRLQPIFKIPSPTSPKMSGHLQRTENSSSGLNVGLNVSEVQLGGTGKHNSYYPSKTGSESGLRLDTKSSPSTTDSGMAFSPIISSPLSMTASPTAVSVETLSTNGAATAIAPTLTSPWKPGRAAFYRVWVPASDPNGWLSDEEMTQCEAELYRAGIWNFLKRGDVVWNTAVGDKLNEGKYVFDGHYLRDLSYAHDVAGHLPSWLNCVLYSPSYWHNIILSSTPRPIIYFDISPWKDQVINSLRLVQDHVEGFSNNGSRYRIAKWLYRSAANISSGQIISKMSASLEIVDEGWNGRIIIETEGTAEHAKALVSRCAGPNATPQAKAALMATVMGDAKAANKAMNTNDTMGLNQFLPTATPSVLPSNEVQNSAWMIMRERSRPGLIWIKLATERA